MLRSSRTRPASPPPRTPRPPQPPQPPRLQRPNAIHERTNRPIYRYPHPAPLSRRNPTAIHQRTNRSSTPTTRSRSCFTRLLSSLLLTVLIGGSAFTTLILLGQTRLLAWLIVGTVLTIVFGTPLLGVLGLFYAYAWAVTPAHRHFAHPNSLRYSPHTPHAPVSPASSPPPASPPIVLVGEIVDDDD